MAVCYRVEEPDDLGRMFAAHDLFSSLVNALFGRTLGPDDDYYAAPWAFLPDRSRDVGHVVFTCRVPWLHGRPPRGGHLRRAREVMVRECADATMVPRVGTAEAVQDWLRLDECDVHAFTADGCYPSARDVSRRLEDDAVRVTCGAMGWEVPDDWREERRREGEYWCVGDVFDLSAAAPRDASGSGRDGAGAGGNNKRMRFSPEQEERPLASLVSHSDGGGGHEEEGDADRGRPTRDTIDPYATLIPPLQCRRQPGAILRPPRLDRGSHGHGDCESCDSDDDRNIENLLDAFYDEDARVVEDRPSGSGYEYVVDPRHGDSFYDRASGDDDGQIEV